MAEIKKLEKITIEVKDGKRVVTVNGESLNLGEIRDMIISFEGDAVAIETKERKYFGW
mgnify:CR=1 FL=1